MSSIYWLVEVVDPMTTMPGDYKLFSSKNSAADYVEDNFGPGEWEDGYVGKNFRTDDDEVLAVLHRISLMED